MYYTRLEYTTTYLKNIPAIKNMKNRDIQIFRQVAILSFLSYMCTRSPALGILELETIVVSCGTNDIIQFRHLIDV